MALRIGCEIFADGRGFKAGLMGIERTAQGFTRRMGSYLAGAFSIGVVIGQIKDALKEASRIEDMSRSLGLSVEQFQELEFAARQTGATMETVGMAIKKIAQAQQAALTGKAGNETAQTFERLGVSMAQLKTMGPQELFKQLSKSVESGSIGVQNMADILDVMGKQANTLIPAMQDGFANMASSARDMGLIIEDEVISRLADMEDQLDILATKWRAVRAEAVIGAASWLDTIKTAVIAEYALLTGTIAGGFEKGRQAYEAVVEAAEEDVAATKEGLAIKKARRAMAAAQGAVAPDFTAEALKQTKTPGFSPATDALARIGGFVGGAGRAIKIQEETLREIKIIRGQVYRFGRFTDVIWG